MTILYHLGKANIVADALSRKAISMGSLVAINVDRRPLAKDLQRLANILVRLRVSEKGGGFIASIDARSSLVEQIGERHFDGERLCLIRDKVLRAKMYHDLSQHYWWCGMKRDIVEFVSRCFTCQQVKCEHQRPGSALQEGLGTRLHMSTTFHLKTDGQSEQMVQVLEDMLRAYVINFGVRWCRSLIEWFDSFEIDSLDMDFLRDAMKKVRIIQGRLLIAQSRVGEVAYKLALPPSLSVAHPVFYVSMLQKYVTDESHVLSLDTVKLGPYLTFKKEPIAILDRQVQKLRTEVIASVKVQWRHRSVGEAT
ncbi:uncharacterized protein LOC129890222 [Solanum dulcamara]|uniref:uncharacterized protein LOC129890222 n=1 Tax=Solanum dulcamara TaxID=45834 RepID=UPI00248597D0|nr:uncharacterized protein LOC129890222 [Solanum dulcamara]